MFNLPAIMKPLSAFSYPFDIPYSACFSRTDGAYTEGTFGGNADDNQKCTISTWFKINRSGSVTSDPLFFIGDVTNHFILPWFLNPGNQLDIWLYSTGSYRLRMNDYIEDTSGWYHLVIALDTTQATEADRVKIYINGNQITDFDVEVYMPQNSNLSVDTGDEMAVGGASGIGTHNTQLAEFNFIDGQQLAPTAFGAFSGGIWYPKQFSGSYGSNGCHYDFADNTDYGNDVSGNNNDITDNAMGTDHQLLDTPTDRICSIHDQGSHTALVINDGGMDPQYAGGDFVAGTGSMAINTGKWYWEFDSNGDASFFGTGIVKRGSMGRLLNGVGANSFPDVFQMYSGYNPGRGYYAINSYKDSDLSMQDANAVMQVAVDADANKIWWGYDNTWVGYSGIGGTPNPSTGAYEFFNNSDGIDFSADAYLPMVTCYGQVLGEINFGQRAFAYTPPTDFLPLTMNNIARLTGTGAVYSSCGTEDDFSSGTYNGNGNANGPCIAIGYRPTGVCIDGTFYDGSVAGVQLLSNGFKIVDTNAARNTNTTSYAWEAWVDNDQKFSLGAINEVT